MLVTSDPNEFIAQLPTDGRWLALDLETTGLNPVRDKIAIIAVSTEDNILIYQTHGYPVPGQLTQELSQRSLITQNGTMFDLLFDGLGIPAMGAHYDTRIAEAICAPLAPGAYSGNSGRANLGTLMRKYTGHNAKLEMPDVGRWTAAELAPDQLEYLQADISYLHDIQRGQSKLIAKAGATEALDLEMACTVPVARMMRNGIPVSQPQIVRFLLQAHESAQEASARLRTAFGATFNVNSPKQVLNALRATHPRLESTDHTALLGLGTQQALDVLTVRAAAKRKAMFTPEWQQAHITDGMLHTKFNQVGAETFRFTSSEPNVQQIPKAMRPIVRAEPGYKILAVDYQQLETRFLADVAYDTDLAYALEHTDLHTENAKFVLEHGQRNVAWESLSAAEQADLRRRTKGLIFTLGFGGGVRGAVMSAARAGEILNEDDAREVLTALRARFPVMATWIDTKRYEAKSANLSVALPFGYVRRWTETNRSASSYINTHMQTAAAVGLKCAIRALHLAGFARYLIIQAHDELVFHVPEDVATPEWVQNICSIMEREMLRASSNKLISFPVEATLSDYWK